MTGDLENITSHEEMINKWKLTYISEQIGILYTRDVDRLTLNDFLIVCSGTNDTDNNYPNAAFSNITNLIKSINHTNIIIVCVPHRHDLKNSSYINNNITLLNSKL